MTAPAESDRRPDAPRKRGRPRRNPEAAAGEDRPFVNALARGLSILRSFRAEDRILGTQEIARRVGLPKATTSRLTQTLAELGYLRAVPALRKYALSSQVLTLGYAALGRTGIVEIARPFMDELTASGEFAVALSVRDGLDMMFIELIRRPQAIMLNLQPGSRVPIHLTAPGRAYLAAAPPAERDAIFLDLAEAHGKAWPGMRKTLEAALERAQRRGYSDSIGDWRPEHNAIATVMRDPLTQDVYIFSLGGLASALPRDRLEKVLAPRIIAAARTIEGRLRSIA